MAESSGTAVAYATKDNIVVPQTFPRSLATLADEARTDLDSRLTGEFADGRVITDAEADASEAAASVLTLQSGSADQDENQLIVLPEDIDGTFTITLAHSGGSGTTTALDLDATAATVQAAVDVVTGAANEVVVTKVTARRAFGLTWSSATEDLTDHAASTVAVTQTGEQGFSLAEEPA
jgi:hypothetical protein